MANRQAGRAAGEAAVGDQGAGLAQSLRLQIAGRIQHLLHARAAARTLVADQHDLAGLDLAGENARDGIVLDFEDMRRAGELQDRSEEHTTEIQSIMRQSYADYSLKKK